MPFSENIVNYMGSLMQIKPIDGWGWAICSQDSVIQEINTPDPFDIILQGVISDEQEIFALSCSSDLVISGVPVSYQGLIARTDSFVDIKEQSVGCNIILSKDRILRNRKLDRWHPDHLYTESGKYIRGFGRVRLSK